MARLRTLALLVIVGLAAMSCTGGAGGGDKAGGPGEQLVLRMADGYVDLDYEPAVAYFVHRAEELSEGALRIDVVHGWGNYQAGFEQQVVRDLGAGKADLGWVGSRIFDTLGDKSFQALTAPMLIDSYALENAVITSDIPGQMLKGLDRLGVTGLAVLGDGLRKPIAVSGPLLGPADWRGIHFAAFRSDGQAAAIRALGALPTDLWSTALEVGLLKEQAQGFEKNLAIYRLNQSIELAPYVTANVNLWPQTVVLLANPAGLTELSDRQRGWLNQAAADAASRSTSLFDDEAGIVTETCMAGARFADASEADLVALREAFVPVYSTLEHDPQTKSFIARIQALKHSVPAGLPLAVPAYCTGTAPGASEGIPEPIALKGTYQWTITKEDATSSSAEDKSPQHLATFPRIFTLTLDKGRWMLSHRGGEVRTDNAGDSYTARGDRVSLHWGESVVTFTFHADDRGNLDVLPVPPMNAADQFVFATHPWTKIAGPRRTTSDLNGTYRANITAAQLRAAGFDDLSARVEGGLITLTLQDGRVNIHREDGTPDCAGTYEAFGDRVSMAGWDTCSGDETMTWVIADGVLRFSDVTAAELNRVWWTAQPWKKIG